MELKKMCDRCFRMLGDSEDVYGFSIVDDNGEERLIKGHKECVDEILMILQQLYGGNKNGKQGN